jgi:DNA-binding beta-propeller fold protein YncE
MVQVFLGRPWLARLSWLAILALVPTMQFAASRPPVAPTPPDLLLEGGRKLSFERSFSSEKEVLGKPKFWTKVLNIVAGEPEYHTVVRPYNIVIDSKGRAIVTDPGAQGIHIFDLAQHKYKFISRSDKSTDPMLGPQCVAVDAEDNIYVTDSVTGKIFVYEANGKFRRIIGSLRGGEGFFKRPTGIAVDSATRRIYVTDTLRDKIFVLDLEGKVLKTIGAHGNGEGEFFFPTELHLDEQGLAVVDAMNFRVQLLDRQGAYKAKFGAVGDSTGDFFRPKGLGEDSEGHYYVVDGYRSMVQVFDQQGQLLYYFGGPGVGLGQFQLPAGLFIDRNDRIFVVDTYNRRVQVFRYFGLRTPAGGGIR